MVGSYCTLRFLVFFRAWQKKKKKICVFCRFRVHLSHTHVYDIAKYIIAWRRKSSLLMSERTCEILARYHAPGAGWYWNPHTAAINIPIYFLTYIFSHYFKKHIEIFFKNSGQQRDSNHRPIDHEPSPLTSTPSRVLCRNIAFYPAWTFTE